MSSQPPKHIFALVCCCLLGIFGVNYCYEILWWNGSNNLGRPKLRVNSEETKRLDTDKNDTKQHYQDRDIGFLHPGKTGGATVSQLIRRACLSKRGCEQHASKLSNELSSTGSKEPQVSKLTTRYYHMRAPPSPSSSHYHRHTSYFLTARDPIDRVASWYIFRHPANAGRWDVSPTRNPKLVQLFDCYPSFEALASQGLSPRISTITRQRRPFFSSFRITSRAMDDNKKDCARLARSVISGTIEPKRDGDHMAWNYGFYLSQAVLQDPTIELFVVRTEYLLEDWISLEVQLGGTPTTSTAISRSVSHQRSQTHQEPLPVGDKTVSQQGIANLCCALRVDLSVYVAALHRAINLEANQIQESLDRLQDKCGPLQTLGKRCRQWDRGVGSASSRSWETAL